MSWFIQSVCQYIYDLWRSYRRYSHLRIAVHVVRGDESDIKTPQPDWLTRADTDVLYFLKYFLTMGSSTIEKYEVKGSAVALAMQYSVQQLSSLNGLDNQTLQWTHVPVQTFKSNEVKDKKTGSKYVIICLCINTSCTLSAFELRTISFDNSLNQESILNLNVHLKNQIKSNFSWE